jgi:hypothetical protein
VSDRVDSSGFLVWILPRVNPKDQVVVDGVPIDGRARLSIGSIVAGY